MGKTVDPNFNEIEGGIDPFSDAGLSESGDPFDFSEVSESPPAGAESASKSGKVPRRQPPPSSPAAPAASPAVDPRAVGLTADVPVQVVAVLGKKPSTVKEIISLKKGQVIELNRFPNEAVDLVANGKLIAKGELVEIDGKLGVRIIKIFE